MPLRPWLVLLLNKFNLFDDMFCWEIFGKFFFSYKFIKIFHWYPEANQSPKTKWYVQYW
jgi:hypothetical protein